MADESKPTLDSFTCPHCYYKLPKWKFLFLTGGAHHQCVNCNTKLSPFLTDTGIEGAVIGSLISMLVVGILILMIPVIGITAFALSLFIIHSLGIYGSMDFFSKNLHLKETKIYSPVEEASGKQCNPFIIGYNTNLTQTPEQKRNIGGFTCPLCRYRFPVRKAIFLTRWTRYHCPSCNSILSPVVKDFQISGMFFGLLGFIGTTLILHTVKPVLGLWVAVIAVLAFVFVGVIFATYISFKCVHLELSK